MLAFMIDRLKSFIFEDYLENHEKVDKLSYSFQTAFIKYILYTIKWSKD